MYSVWRSFYFSVTSLLLHTPWVKKKHGTEFLSILCEILKDFQLFRWQTWQKICNKMITKVPTISECHVFDSRYSFIFITYLLRSFFVFATYGVFTRSSKRPALARVFWIHLLEVCWTFAGSRKHSITFNALTLLFIVFCCISPPVFIYKMFDETVIIRGIQRS